MKEFTCIICPRGCRLKIDDNLKVYGNTCLRGEKYAKEEVTCPKRTITSTVRVCNRPFTLVSVKTSTAVPKEMIQQIMEEIDKLKVEAPTKVNDVILTNVLNTGADIIITKNIK